MIWLLDMEIGGRLYRFASEACEVSDAHGNTWLYSEGLADPTATYGSTYGVGEVSIPLTIDSDDDWALVVAQGHPLVRRPATLRLWDGTSSLERARVVLRGLTGSPNWGARGEGISLSIVRSPRSETISIPDEQAVVTETTFPDAPAQSLGKAYPIVIGCPGHTEAATPVAVVPVPQVQYLDPKQEIEETFSGEDSLLAPAVYDLTYVPLTSRVYRTPFGGDEYELLRNVDWQVGVTPTYTASLIIHTRVELEAVDEIRIVYSYVVPTDYTGTRSTVAWIGGHASQVWMEIVPSGEPGRGDLRAAYPVASITDGLGRTLSAVERPFPMAGGEDDGIGSAGDEFFLGFRDDAVYGGGVLTRRGALLRAAGDLLEWVLTTHHDGPVDFGRLSAVKNRLNIYKIDTWLDKSANVMEWLRREILVLLPVELREGEKGLYPAMIRYDLTAADCVTHLDATYGGVQRSSDVTLSDGDIRNEVSVKFRKGRDADWLAYRMVTAQAGYRTQVLSFWVARELGVTETTVFDSSIIPLPACAKSQALYGVKPFEVTAFALWDSATAAMIATDLANRYALPRVKVQYTGDVEHLEVGDGVLLTDPELHMSQVVAVITDVGPATSGGDATVDLLIL